MSYPAKILIANGQAKLVIRSGKRWRPAVETRYAFCGYTIYIPEWETKRAYAKSSSTNHYCGSLCQARAHSSKKKFATNYCIICSVPFRVYPPSHADRYKACSERHSGKYRCLLTEARRHHSRSLHTIIQVGTVTLQDCCWMAGDRPTAIARLR